MSTSSKPRSRTPAHANKTAFRHNKGSKLTKKISESVTEDGLCQQCKEKQQWRVKYRKYKPLTAPRKCNSCGGKAIKAAYRTHCEPCASSQRVCASCGRGSGECVLEEGSGSKNELDANQVKEVLRGMTERQRRTVARRVNRGEEELSVVNQLMCNAPNSDNDVDDGEISNSSDEDSDGDVEDRSIAKG